MNDSYRSIKCIKLVLYDKNESIEFDPHCLCVPLYLVVFTLLASARLRKLALYSISPLVN